MPLRGIERGQQVVELAGPGVETDLECQLLDQPVELIGVLLDERAGEGLEMLDLGGRRSGREDVSDQIADLRAVEADALPLPQCIEPAVELALEPIDRQRIETAEAVLVEQLIEPVLAFDQEMQTPFAVPDVEGEQVLHPGWNLSARLRL